MLILEDFDFFWFKMLKIFHEKLVPEKKSHNIFPLILCDTFISVGFMAWGRSLREIVLSVFFFKKKNASRGLINHLL